MPQLAAQTQNVHPRNLYLPERIRLNSHWVTSNVQAPEIRKGFLIRWR